MRRCPNADDIIRDQDLDGGATLISATTLARFMVLALVLLMGACAAPAAPSGGPAPREDRPAQPAAPKKLTIALQREYETADGGEGALLLRDGLVLNQQGVQT